MCLFAIIFIFFLYSGDGGGISNAELGNVRMYINSAQVHKHCQLPYIDAIHMHLWTNSSVPFN